MPLAPPSWPRWRRASLTSLPSGSARPIRGMTRCSRSKALGVVLAAVHADRLADAAGIRLRQLAGLDWTGFPRSEAPVWYDQVAATLRAHGISLNHQPAPGEGP